jgi:hypothetical protein
MDAVITLFLFILLSIVLALANLERFHEAFRWMAIAAVVVLNSLFILMGLAGLAMPMTVVPGLPPSAINAMGLFLRAMGLTGLLAFVPLLPPVRRLLARYLHIDPGSTVHTVALVYAVYLVGAGIGQQPLASDPEVLGSLGDVGVSSTAIWAQALGMVLLAVTGVGMFTRRDMALAADRLGLKVPTLSQLGVAVLAVVGLIIFQIVFMLAWNAVDPESLKRISDASNLLLGGMTGLGGALTIGLAAALGEEMIFRGAAQPPFRLLVTAVLFTILHSQYGFSPASLLIFVIAIVLGVLRYRTNLTVCILVHFGYNFTSVLLPTIGQ